MSCVERTILLTRPYAESETLAEDIRVRGFAPFIEPMLNIILLNIIIPDLNHYQALIFTSGNGVTSFARLNSTRTLPVLTVGDATAEAARTAGFSDVRSAGGTLEDLNALAEDMNFEPGIPVLHVSGIHTAGDVVIPHVPVNRVAAYRADKVTALSEECLDCLDRDNFTAVMFYSPRAAENFAELIVRSKRTDRLATVRALCISPAVVKCLGTLPWQDVQVADTPGRGGMLALIDKLAQTGN